MTKNAFPGPAGRTADVSAPPPGLADVIADQSVRAMYHRLVEVLRGLHTDVGVRESGVELRAEFGGRMLCRVVPYRELLHVQVGDSPTWEVRVRDESGFLEALDRTLAAFLRIVAGSRPPAGTARTNLR